MKNIQNLNDIFDINAQEETSALPLVPEVMNANKEMDQEDDALKAVENLNGKPFMGRPLTVNEARPREEGKREGSYNRRGYDART